jgi:Tfp pilus assembly protein PilX
MQSRQPRRNGQAGIVIPEFYGHDHETTQMQLSVFFDNNQYSMEIAESLLQEGESFFEKINQDMDRGWQISREWVDNPSQLQRCQIVAGRLADAIVAENHILANLTAAYILLNMPGVKSVYVDSEGDMQETRFE